MYESTDATQVLTEWQPQSQAVQVRESTRTFPLFAGDSCEQEIDAHCLSYARKLYPRALTIAPVVLQGGCSFTVMIQHDGRHSQSQDPPQAMVQYRLPQFAFDMEILDRVNVTVGPLTPNVTHIGQLHVHDSIREVYSMSVVPGIRFDREQPHRSVLGTLGRVRIENLLESLAAYFATCYDSALTESISERARCSGRIGSTVVQRLAQLSLALPTHDLRARARGTLEAVENGALDVLPIVLTHGDILPTNIFVDDQTWTLTGLVDWAEAEDLPFGIGMYGIDHLLGFVAASQEWVWYDQAPELRRYFWSSMEQRVPAFSKTRAFRASVHLARDVGVLLWHGFAWDDGRLNRVVNEEHDREELALMRAFLA